MDRENANTLYDLLDNFYYDIYDNQKLALRNANDIFMEYLKTDNNKEITLLDIIAIVQDIMNNQYLKINKCWNLPT